MPKPQFSTDFSLDITINNLLNPALNPCKMKNLFYSLVVTYQNIKRTFNFQQLFLALLDLTVDVIK